MSSNVTDSKQLENLTRKQLLELERKKKTKLQLWADLLIFFLPFVGGLVAPNQGFFPKYDAGQFDEENTTMIVSRGVGNSIIPIRFNNRPEIVVAQLKSQ